MEPLNETLAAPMDPTHAIERTEEYSANGVERETALATSSRLQPIEIAWLLWGDRRFLARLTAWGLAFFTLLAFFLPKRYTATTQLMPPDYNSVASLALGLPSLSSESGGSGTGGSVMSLANQLLGLNNSGDLIVGVLQSRTIEDEIISQFGLMKLYSARYPEDARKKLESNVTIKSDTKTGIISLAVEDKDPRRAAAIARAYVEGLNQLLAKVNSSAAQRERMFIEQRLSQIKQELDTSAKQFSEFASKNSAINIPDQAKAMVVAAADLQAQLIAAQAQLKGLQQIYTDSNFRVRQMKAQVAELQHQMEKFAGKDINLSTGTSLAQGELYPSIRQLPLLGVRYLDLYRRNKINEAAFEFLTKQYELAKIQEARDVPSVQLLDAALVPQKKSFPHRLWIMLGGMCSCFLAGAGWIIGNAYWERRDPQDPWKAFAQEVFDAVRVRTWDSAIGLRIRAGIGGIVRRLPVLRRLRHQERPTSRS